MCVSVCYIKCLPEFHPYKRTLDSGSKDQFRKENGNLMTASMLKYHINCKRLFFNCENTFVG